jgi:hypothetical protein
MNDEGFNSLGDLQFTDADFFDPLAWVERLTPRNLEVWLRRAVWTGYTLPIIIPHSSRVMTHLTDLFSGGSAQLTCNLRSLIPDLLREWGRNDEPQVLDDLLVLTSKLRCVSAQPTIIQIATERLSRQAETIRIRERCLGVISGFGCTEKTVHFFRRFITDISYAPTCYRALYRYDPDYAATELPQLLALFSKAGLIADLKPILHVLFVISLKPSQREKVWKTLFTTTAPETLIQTLQYLKEVGIIVSPPFKSEDPREHIEVSYSGLMEGSPSESDIILTDDLPYEVVRSITYSLETGAVSEDWIREVLSEYPVNHVI